MQDSNTKTVLIVVAAVVVGVLATIVWQKNYRTDSIQNDKTIGEAIDDAGDNLEEAGEEIKDEIDDHTTSN